VPEGPLEFAPETPRPADGTRFDIYPKPGDPDRGTLVLNPLNGRYHIVSSDYAEVEGARVLRVWYERVPPD
jgi:hypothetical protein